MISVSQSTLDALNQSTSITAEPGCWFEYNMNDLISGVTVRGPNGTEANPEGSLTVIKTASDGSTYKPFTKLFPLTSIIEPRRPKKAGVQYFILGDPGAQKTIMYSADTKFNTRMYFPGVKTSYKYWVTPKASGTSLSGCVIDVNYPSSKNASINKVAIKFEPSHGLPATWSVKATTGSGQITLATHANASVPSDGLLNLYYNGSSWSTTEFTNPSSPISITKITLEINSVTVANGYVGIIEISGRYVKNVSSDLISFETTKSASDQNDSVIPVSLVTSNLANINFNYYDKSFVLYDKSYNNFDSTKTNFYKDVIVSPFFKIGSDKISQGTFFMTEYSADEFGNVTVQAQDGAKELQEIFPPDILVQESSSQAIIRRLLDSIGFTNYNFNSADTDTSSIRPYYWYTDPGKTVWEHIQDICKDTQTIATFDENNILQFYTRDYIFRNRTSDFKFRFNANGSNLANIINLNSVDVPSVKSVKIMYAPRLSASYYQNSDPLYDAPVLILGAASLQSTLPASAPAQPDLNGSGAAPLGVISLKPILIDGYATKFNSFSGYFVVNQEVIEYDAIKYQYADVDTGAIKYRWITSDADVSKWEGLSKPNSFKPEFEYRIKTRNAFNVLPEPVAHEVNIASLKAEWTATILDESTQTTSVDNTKFTLDDIAKEANTFGIKFANDVPRSMMTIFAPDTQKTTSTDESGATTYVYTDNKKYTMVSPNTISPDYTTGSPQYFLIGTSMYFPLIKNASGQDTGEQRTKGAIAFCLGSDNKSGYLLEVNTTQNVTKDKNYKDVTMYKIVNGKLQALGDTQTGEGATPITGIDGGELYKIDIKVARVTSDGVTANIFKVIFNGTRIVIKDVNPLPITSKLALCSMQGATTFDYVYATSINDSEFAKDLSYDPYKSFLGINSKIIQYFSDFVFSKSGTQSKPLWLKEFGPVAREIKRITFRYSNPGFPKFSQVILNPNVSVVGQSLDSFTADVFVINNSGAFTPLSDGTEKRFSIVGDSIQTKDAFEYIDPTLSEEDKKQGIVFDSTWIQKDSEAKSLHDWIRKQWSKQQRVVDIESFFNPLLEIGDLIEISYPDNGLYSSEDTVPSGQSVGKYVVIQVSNSSDLGSGTKVRARSIFTG
jgi:hypothetical protein